jgi:predicted Zn finger-like uncharacterized protein
MRRSGKGGTMKIQCPECKLTGQVSLAAVPEAGAQMKCPRCNASFMVKRNLEESEPGGLVSTCPACYYSTFSEEVFDICPRCGVVAKDHRKPVLDPGRLEDDRAREEKKRLEDERLRAAALIVPEPAAIEAVAAPPVVTGLGSVCAAASVAVVLLGGYGLFRFITAAPPDEEIVSPIRLFLTTGLIPSLQLLVGIFALAASTGFLLLKPWGRSALDCAARVGIGLAVVSETWDLAGWISRGGGGGLGYFAVGIASYLMMLALWGVPLVFLARYLRGREIRKLFCGE